jgi:hypothetical protein|tara:strand:+ start:94 stop:339 length:246 start_codon:yes stop_codon:yes gene_type:complete
MSYEHFYNTIKQHLRYHPSERKFADPKDENLRKMCEQLLELVNEINPKITMKNITTIEEVASGTSNYCHWLSVYCKTIANN